MRSRSPLSLVASVLLVVLGFASAGSSWAYPHSRSFAGVVSQIDVVGKAIEVRSNEASVRSQSMWFRVAEATQIRSQGRAGSITDLQPGAEVIVTYSPARVPRTAERVEVR